MRGEKRGGENMREKTCEKLIWKEKKGKERRGR